MRPDRRTQRRNGIRQDHPQKAIDRNDQAEAALGGWFQMGNLSALREIALLWLASTLAGGRGTFPVAANPAAVRPGSGWWPRHVTRQSRRTVMRQRTPPSLAACGERHGGHPGGNVMKTCYSREEDR
jgi:hypothetical protein